ncbi:MAG: hypothetical protein JO301_05230 [Chitinophagaceae bacterium]|nr:hypothetical protein [Chitinophagaceae bacterium]
MSQNGRNKTGISELAGLVVFAIIGASGLYLLRRCWPAYAVAAADKSYTIGMLWARLGAGILASILSTMTATFIAKDRGNSAVLTGLLLFAISAYIHFCRVWNDYPVWYHLTYLSSLILIPMLHKLFRR